MTPPTWQASGGVSQPPRLQTIGYHAAAPCRGAAPFRGSASQPEQRVLRRSAGSVGSTGARHWTDGGFLVRGQGFIGVDEALTSLRSAGGRHRVVVGYHYVREE